MPLLCEAGKDNAAPRVGGAAGGRSAVPRHSASAFDRETLK